MVFSLTADTFGSAQTVATAFFLMAAGVAQASVARERALATQQNARPLSPTSTARLGAGLWIVDVPSDRDVHTVTATRTVTPATGA